MQRFFEGKKWVLAVAIVLVGAYARAQGTKDTLTLNLAKAKEIALRDIFFFFVFFVVFFFFFFFFL